MKIKLYTTHCPQCKGVEMLLKKKNVEYEECTDIEELRALGIQQVPVLSVDGKLLKGKEIHEWLHSIN